MLINMDQAGDIGSRADDVLLLGKCDEVVRELCQALGDDWVEDLDAAWKETEKYAKKEEEGETKQVEGLAGGESTAVTKDEEVLAESKLLHDEVEKLTQQIETALKLDQVPPKSDDGHVSPSLEEKSGDDLPSESTQVAAATGDSSDPHATEEQPKAEEVKDSASEKTGGETTEVPQTEAKPPAEGKL